MCFIMSKPKISVILPVYNVEDYLSETLNSLLNQTMIDDIEVIMVDDGSNDESRYIIERYAFDYDNFHAYHKDNEGQGITRNHAMKLAKGDYVHFLDSDDFIPPKAYEILYEIASKNDSDMAICNVMRFARYNVWEDILFKHSFRGIDEVIVNASLDEMSSLVWDTITCNKLYKREFLLENGIEFPNRKISFEDIPFSLESYILSDKISMTPEICYYWRLRGDNTSTTQQDLDVSSISDRLEILDMVHQLLVKHNVNGDVANEEYLKWTAHDLKFFIKRFDHFPQDQHRQLFDRIRELVMLIPEEIIEGLNSYRKAIFRMVLNNDFESFMLLAPMEDELCENPHIPDFLDDEYKSCFDFERAMKDEELLCEISDVDFDESSIYINFRKKMNYLGDDGKYEVSSNLLDGNGNRYPVDVDGSQIIIPMEFIRDKAHSQIDIQYEFEDFKKHCILKNRHRRSMEFEDCFIDFNIGTDSQLYIDIMDKSDNNIEITDIAYEDGEFILEATSKGRIDEVYIENVISFERIICPVEYESNKDFTFRISENKLLDEPIKKWEINCKDSQNSIMVSKSFEFYRNHDKIRFINSRNKILIEDDVNSLDELNNEINDLKSEVSSLKGERYRMTSENKRLEKENAQLRERIEEFKSRKVVRMADKLKLR